MSRGRYGHRDWISLSFMFYSSSTRDRSSTNVTLTMLPNVFIRASYHELLDTYHCVRDGSSYLCISVYSQNVLLKCFLPKPNFRVLQRNEF